MHRRLPRGPRRSPAGPLRGRGARRREHVGQVRQRDLPRHPGNRHLRRDRSDHRGVQRLPLDPPHDERRARRLDRSAPDLHVAASFVELIERARKELPESRLVFNNVNDFPTWATAGAPQDAVYIEVWPPHTTLGSLAHVINRAKGARRGQPIVLAAYQHVYSSSEDQESADRATALTMATAFSHGATQLLAGEADRILVDPYYVNNHVANTTTEQFLARWYDFLVEHDELLMDPAIVEVTGSYAGGYNDDADAVYADTPVSDEPAPGAVWRRITQGPSGLVMHLINLKGQEDALWDSPRREPVSPGTATLRYRRTGRGLPRIRVADPDLEPRLTDVHVVVDGDYVTAQLPAPRLWQIVQITED
ncbi:glycoside hydrolase family 66 protein [Sinomonas sp. JGH33]|uniref:Glycoside hydrolase family 66 protein n=1 Tax=Sinomonas terricola TaxID=3110330 RepID=A0ABU5T7Y6_9MICC|nr:glycoside hydrolase family 66 protein [Sinomonas sp. JGH33]MEA5455784.1 glycoside hydrolase family 66 protein [Sinomonas sp. JGH33]